MESIADKVAIIGMGCTKFGENWTQSSDDMIIDAAHEALQDAGLELNDIQAFWAGTQMTGISGATLAHPLKIQYKPVCRVENLCTSGAETIRSGAHAVASGHYDLVMAVGFDKLKDNPGAGSLAALGTEFPGGDPPMTNPALFAFAAARYFHQYKLTPEEGKRMLADIAVLNHYNGSLAPKAHFRKRVTAEQVMNAPIVAWPLGLFDCCGVSDGAAAAILVRADLARNYRDDPVYIKALQSCTGPCDGGVRTTYDYVRFEEDIRCSRALFEEGGIKEPDKEISTINMHDCFTIAQAISLEDFGLVPRGRTKEAMDAGTFSLEGRLPVNTDGGLKSFGHPVGATGLRQVYELYKQLQGKAEERQLKDPKLAMSHVRGGWPGYTMTTMSLLAR